MGEFFDKLETRSDDERSSDLSKAIPLQIKNAKENSKAFSKILADVDPSEINSVEDNSNIYSASDDSYEVVKQWKLQVTVKMSWYDIKSSQIILDKKIQEWALYDNSGLDVSIDGIDNDSDGLIDSEDSDEYGTSREAALRITSDKLINRILNELISNW